MGLGSGIRDPEKTYSGSRGQKGTGSRIRIRNTGSSLTFLTFRRVHGWVRMKILFTEEDSCEQYLAVK
jgi:hypothetical protein